MTSDDKPFLFFLNQSRQFSYPQSHLYSELHMEQYASYQSLIQLDTPAETFSNPNMYKCTVYIGNLPVGVKPNF